MGIQEWSDKIIVVDLSPEPDLRDELTAAMETAQKRRDCSLVLDFSDVSIITSSSISALLQISKLIRGTDQRLIICGMSSATKGVFKVAGIAEIFNFVSDKFSALAGLQLVANT